MNLHEAPSLLTLDNADPTVTLHLNVFHLDKIFKAQGW